MKRLAGNGRHNAVQQTNLIIEPRSLITTIGVLLFVSIVYSMGQDIA